MYCKVHLEKGQECAEQRGRTICARHWVMVCSMGRYGAREALKTLL